MNIAKIIFYVTLSGVLVYAAKSMHVWNTVQATKLTIEIDRHLEWKRDREEYRARLEAARLAAEEKKEALIIKRCEKGAK